MDFIISLAPGAAIVAVGYFLYLAATRGLPAALAWARTRWNSAKNDLVTLRGDLTEAQARLAKLEADIVALKAPAA